MNEPKNPNMRKQEREQLVELGSDLTSNGNSMDCGGHLYGQRIGRDSGN